MLVEKVFIYCDIVQKIGLKFVQYFIEKLATNY